MFDGVACLSPFGAFGYGLYLGGPVLMGGFGFGLFVLGPLLGGSGLLVSGPLGLSSGTGSDGFEGFDGSDGFEGFGPFFLEASIAFFALSLYS